MKALLHWLAMGGYALYVWPAYALVTGLLIVNLVAIKRQRTKTLKHLRLWLK